jgi:glycosyltransferase involved in cell wall biosynthesis
VNSAKSAAPPLTSQTVSPERGVTVIVPAYNYAQYLEGAVRSALAQTHQPIEVIIVDDGSTDATPELGQRLARDLNGVRYVRQTNAGLSAARNTGIAMASYPFVTFLDSDDEYLPNMAEELMRAFDEQPADTALIACATIRIDAEGNPIGEKKLPPRGSREYSAADILIKSRFPCCVIARRASLEAVGPFDTMLRSSEDRDMWIRIGCKYRIYFVDQRLVRIRRHTTNMSRNTERMRGAMRRVRSKAIRARVVPLWNVFFWLRVFSFDHFQGAWMFWDQGRALPAIWHVALSLILWPLPMNNHDLVEPPLFRIRAAARFILTAPFRKRAA